MNVAALFVEPAPHGAYTSLPGVDAWDEARDARLYDGPHPVVAHPPCTRWCRLAGLVEKRWGYKRGDDGGCFASALASVRKWGGVLEHPAYSKAWPAHGLESPPTGGHWVKADEFGGFTCYVEQHRYGHEAKKATWLYACGVPLPELKWGHVADQQCEALVSWCGNKTKRGDKRKRLGGRAASATPSEFREVLLAIARGRMKTYEDFVASKLVRVPPTGMASVPELHASLFPHQKDLVTWALRRGRSAVFAATGLGKSRIEVEWARHVAAHTNRAVLILAPLAVAQQTIREAEHLGVTIRYLRHRDDIADDETGVFITNYDRIHLFDAGRFGGVVLDESSIIKHHTSKTLKHLLDAFAQTAFKLCATATPAPNDYTELGTHAEFLGICTQSEMLAEYFCHGGGETQVWRLKGHARTAFWRWVATWGALLRKPSDLGYADEGYALPPLIVTPHIIPGDLDQAHASGTLFPIEAKTFSERRGARKGSMSARVDQCVVTVALEPDEQWLIWCDLNAESEALSKAIPGAVEIRGSNTSEEKEAALLGFAEGRIRVLVTKPSIAGWGMNFQIAARMAFVGVTDSWEAYYQAVRREWRFGQKRAVEVHVFASEVEGRVVENLRRKEFDAERMADELAVETREAMRAEVHGSVRATNEYRPIAKIVIPNWLKEEVA